MKSISIVAFLSICSAASSLTSQAPNTSTHVDRAMIQHGSHAATVTALEARPLDQSIEALRDEYGWLLDYEDPVYSGNDLTDVTDQDWHSKYQHAPGLKRPAGKSFSSTYPEAANMDTEQARRSVLEKVLSDYAKSGNPGKFTLVQTAPSRFDVIGHSDSSRPVLDTPVTVDVEGESAWQALDDVLQDVHNKTGHVVGLGFVPTNLLTRCPIDQRFMNTPARTAILSIIERCHTTLLWRFLYDANSDMFLLNLSPPVPKQWQIRKDAPGD